MACLTGRYGQRQRTSEGKNNPIPCADQKIGVLGFCRVEISFDIRVFDFQRREATGVCFDCRHQAVKRPLAALIRKPFAVAVNGANGVCASFAALQSTRECVIAIPTVDLLDVVVGIGTCSGADTDKFAKFKLTAMPGKLVNAPLIRECLANIECKVVDLIAKHNIVVLQAVAAYEDPARKEKRTVHAVGDGTFIVDGRKLDRRKMMASKLPAGL